MHGLQIHRRHAQPRQRGPQLRQVLAYTPQRLLRAQHEPHHQLAGMLRQRHQHMLQLAAAGGDVVRRDPRQANERLQRRETVPQCRRVERTVHQRHPLSTGIDDPQHRLFVAAADRHLRLVAKARLRARHRRQPFNLVIGSQQPTTVRHLGGQLLGIGLLDQGTGAATARGVVGTVHGGWNSRGKDNGLFPLTRSR